MTRRSITAALGSLLVGLLFVVQSPAVVADMPCEGMTVTGCHFTQVNVGPAAVNVNVNRVCHVTYSDAYVCAVFGSDGTWLRDESTDNGNWSVTAQAAPREDIYVNRVCHFTYSDEYLCAVFQTDGTWLRDEMMENGNWNVIAQAVPVNEIRLP